MNAKPQRLRALEDHKRDLSDFLTNDPRGQRVIPNMSNLARHLEQECDQLGKEVASLVQHVSHIKEIVSMQQAYELQGYYFSRPLKVQDVASKLRKSLTLMLEENLTTVVA